MTTERISSPKIEYKNYKGLEAELIIGGFCWYMPPEGMGRLLPGGYLDDAHKRVVTAVNCHDELLAACKSAIAYDEAIHDVARKERVSDGKSWVTSEKLDDLYLDWMTKARAAIDKAEGEA